MEPFKPRAVRKKKKAPPALPVTADAPAEPIPAAAAAAAAAAAVVGPDASTPADASTSASAPPPAPLLPRAVAKKKKPPARPVAAPVASTSATVAERAPQAAKPDPNEAERLELVLWTVEGCMSDWGLSMHQDSGLFARLRDSKDGLVHVQQLLLLPPLQALAASQMDVQKALRSRPSSIVTLSETGFQVGRVNKPDFARLKELEPADWDPLYLYIENIPLNPAGPHTSASLALFLSTILSTSIQRVLLPPLVDPTANTAPPTEDPSGQHEAFVASLLGRGLSRLQLPTGGGPYKGFAFVVVAQGEDVERILREWPWAIPEKKIEPPRPGESEVERLVRLELERMEADSPRPSDTMDADGKSPVARKVLNIQKSAKDSGLRSLSYKRYLELKSEYLAYQKTLAALREASAARTKPDARAARNARWSKNEDDSQSDTRSAPKWGHDGFESRHKQQRPAPPKRPRIEEPQQDLNRPPSPPGVELEADAAVDVRGAFPKGCVLWIRNLFAKSTRSSLRAMLTEALEEIEGSGKGIEFVDYEKGLDTCHVRLASSHLASLIHTHFLETPLVQTAPAVLTPLSLAPVDPADPPRAIKSDILEGTRERLYWENLPESSRRAARASASGPAAIAVVGKKRKRAADEREAVVVDAPTIRKKLIQEVITPLLEAASSGAAEEASPERQRKKASKF